MLNQTRKLTYEEFQFFRRYFLCCQASKTGHLLPISGRVLRSCLILSWLSLWLKVRSRCWVLLISARTQRPKKLSGACQEPGLQQIFPCIWQSRRARPLPCQTQVRTCRPPQTPWSIPEGLLSRPLLVNLWTPAPMVCPCSQGQPFGCMRESLKKITVNLKQWPLCKLHTNSTTSAESFISQEIHWNLDSLASSLISTSSSCLFPGYLSWQYYFVW